MTILDSIFAASEFTLVYAKGVVPPADQQKIRKTSHEDLLNNHLKYAVMNSFYALEVMTRIIDMQGKIQNDEIDLNVAKKRIVDLLEEEEEMKKQVEITKLEKVLTEQTLDSCETRVGVLERSLASKDEEMLSKDGIIVGYPC